MRYGSRTLGLVAVVALALLVVSPAGAADKGCDTDPNEMCGELRSAGAGGTGTATGSQTSSSVTDTMSVEAVASAGILPVGAGPIAASDSRSWARLEETQDLSTSSVTITTATSTATSARNCIDCTLPVLQTTSGEGYLSANITYFGGTNGTGDIVGSDSATKTITLNGALVDAAPAFSFVVPSGATSARAILELGAIAIARGGPGNNSSVDVELSVTSWSF